MVSRHPADIEALQRKKDKVLYNVGQFILREMERESAVFHEIERMTAGFFVSTALYAQPIPTSPINSKFKRTTVYLDTRIILCALGYHLPEERDAAIQLLDMLKKGGASIACFNHTLEEMESILTAYKQSLLCPRQCSQTRYVTLEGLNAKGCTPGRVDVIRRSLTAKLHALGMEINERLPEITDGASLIDEQRLKTDLQDVGYSNDKARLRDADSVAGVCLLREGKRANSIEQCGALFLTTNASMKKIANKSVGATRAETVPPVLLDIELGAMLWLKSYAVYGDYPQRKLIEDATLSLLPSESIMRAFYDAVDDALSSQTIAREEYDALRLGLFEQKELMHSIGGDEDQISEKTVVEVVDTLREMYRADNNEDLKVANAVAEDEKHKNDEAKTRALAEITEVGRRRYDAIRNVGRVIIVLMLALFTVITVRAIASSYMKNDTHLMAMQVFLFVLELLGDLDLAFGKRKHLFRLVDRIAESSSGRVKDRERVKFERVFGNDLG